MHVHDKWDGKVGTRLHLRTRGISASVHSWETNEVQGTMSSALYMLVKPLIPQMMIHYKQQNCPSGG